LPNIWVVGVSGADGAHRHLPENYSH